MAKKPLIFFKIMVYFSIENWYTFRLTNTIGNDIYLKYLKNINYGNEKTGPIVESFWLEGDLRITAVEQIELLRKIYNKELKFDERNYIILKNIMKVDENEKYCVRAKTNVIKLAKQ